MVAWNIGLPKAECYELGDSGIERVIREVIDAKEVAFDTETTGLNIIKDIPVFWSLSWGENRVVMPANTMPLFKKAFDDPEKIWIMHNAKFDAHMARNVGIRIRGRWHDTAVMHALLYEEVPHGLKEVSKQLLSWGWAGFKETFGNFHESETGRILQETWATNRAKVVEYAGNDAYGTFKIYQEMKKRLLAEQIWTLYPDMFPNMWELFYKTEAPFTKVLWKCERHGVKIDLEYLASLEKPVTEEINQLVREISRLASELGWVGLFNPNASPQVRKLCLEYLKLKPRRLTKGGKSGVKMPSVDAEFLEEHSDIPIIKHILRYRDLEKLRGTYILGLQEKVDHLARIHPRYNQDVARTGRLSSSDPNAQNIPNTDNDKFKVRKAFICEPGNLLIVNDYSALEMRLLAAAAGEADMIQIFKDGKDIHMGNASLVFGFPYDDIVKAKKLDGQIKKMGDAVKQGKATQEEYESLKVQWSDYLHECLMARGYAKAIGFGLNYGMKENKLARSINKTPEEAKQLMEQYMARYPAVEHFFKSSVANAQLTQKSYTLLGRRRFLADILSSSNYDRYAAERQAVNNVIQGSAADLVRMAMIKIDGLDLEDKYGCHMLMQVHDELVFECPEETVEEVQPIIKEAMEHSLPSELPVYMEASTGKGTNWADAK